MGSPVGEVRVGISGWRYAGWRGDFYPAGLPQRAELEYAASKLSAIEVNGSFYSLQRPSSYAAWHDATPDDFVFTVKGGRYITHLLRLRNVDAALSNFFASGVLALRDKLGPVLWQLPANLRFEPEVLDDFLGRLPRTTTIAAELAARHDDKVPDDRALTTAHADRPVRHALEFRSETFVDEAAYTLLREHGVACVLADTAGRWPRVEVDTADFRYVRLHGDTELYTSGYDGESLDGYAEKAARWAREGQDVFVFFDNDAKGFAPHDAMGLIARLADRP